MTTKLWKIAFPALLALGSLQQTHAQAFADSVVVINEINYNPSSDNDTEWIEIRNLMGVDVDISGWSLDQGVNFTFPAETRIAGHGHIVIAAAPGSASLSGTGAMGPFDGGLSNSGESIRLVNNSGRTMDRVSYEDDGDWPAGADGFGATLSKIDEDTAASEPSNWAISAEIGGTPGASNFPDGKEPDTLVFNEIAAAGSDPFEVEIRNLGPTTVALANYLLTSETGSYLFPVSTLAPGETLALNTNTLGFTPADDERLSLYTPDQNRLLQTRTVTGRLRGLTEEGRWEFPTVATFGLPNIFFVNTSIVINEIMYNARPIRSEQNEIIANTLIDWNDTWRYNVRGSDLGNTWEQQVYPVGGDWQQGPAPIGRERSNGLPIPLQTDLDVTNGTAAYFQIDFEVTSAALEEIGTLLLTHLIDDGAIFYLNGVEIERFNMDPEPTTFESISTGGVEATFSEVIEIPTTSLLVGTNQLSVEVHQISEGFNNDFVMAARLESAPSLDPFQVSQEQWIELHNRGTSTVDISSWELDEGVSYEFPAGTSMAPGSFLVVAGDAEALAERYSNITILGNWDRNLSRGGETLVLRDASRNTVDEVSYLDSGRWPSEADGTGASLELIDPDADNNIAGSWSFSDEGARSEWVNYSYRGSGQNNENDPQTYHEFLFGLLDDGEFLIDDISVIENPDGAARQLIQNGDFSNGTEAWRFIGTHRDAEVISDPDGTGQVLRMRASGSYEHQHNQSSTTLKDGNNFIEIDEDATYEISFRAKWISGSNQFHSRLYFNRAARKTFLETPGDGGTPGTANSRQVNNAGPSMTNLSHFPVVPRSGQTCEVTIDASDADGISSLTLFYSVNGGSFQTTGMTSDGEGRWSGTIPGQSSRRIVQFYVQGQDSQGAQSLFPPNGPDSGALIPWQDNQENLDLGDCQPNNFRIVMTTANSNFMHTDVNVMSNDRLPCTVIWNEERIFYDCGVRLKGSMRGRSVDVRVGFNVGFLADNPFLGSHETVSIDRSGSGSEFSQKEILVKHTLSHAGRGIPAMEDDLIRVIAPRSIHTGSAMLLKSRYDSEYLNHAYEDGNDGTAWEYELIYYPTTTVGNDPEGLKIPNPNIVEGVPARSLGTDPELYRWYWLIKNNRDEDNYAPLVDLLGDYGQAATSDAFEDIDEILDTDQFLRAFAAQVLFGIGDSYSSGSEHNAYFYQRPSDGKFLFLPWDMDFAFRRDVNASITPSNDLNKLLLNPANRRAYLGHLQDIIETSYNTNHLTYWANHYSCFLPTENLANFLPYISARGSFTTSQISAQIPEVSFEITNPIGSTPQTTYTVEGQGWVDIRSLRVVGSPEPLDLTWDTTTTFTFELPVQQGENNYTIEALDFDGNVIDFQNVTVTGTGSVVPATAGLLVISELMYNPGDDDQEFIELLNISDSLTIDLNGVSFGDGIDFTFSDSQLAPGQRLVLARSLPAFLQRYGNIDNLVGGYADEDGSNRLSNGGERIVLLDLVGTTILDFTYSDSDPWPASADGPGYSLELISPFSNPDPNNPLNWRSSQTTTGSPGASGSENISAWATSNGITNLSLDPDNDGLTNLQEFLFGTNPALADSASFTNTFDGDRFIMEVTVRNGADGASIRAEESSDLSDWNPALYLGRRNNGDGLTSQLLFTSSTNPINGAKLFMRTISTADTP